MNTALILFLYVLWLFFKAIWDAEMESRTHSGPHGQSLDSKANRRDYQGDSGAGWLFAGYMIGDHLADEAEYW